MEFDPRVTFVERAITGVILALVVGVAVLERRSPVASALREGRPVDFVVHGLSARLLPSTRTLWLVGDGTAALEEKKALLHRPFSLKTELAPLDRVFLILEIARLRADDISPAWAAEAEEDKLLLAAALEGQTPAPKHETITVEVLNGSGVAGLASAAKDRLREKGADVLISGNASEQTGKTLILDRVAAPARARRIAKMISCPDAETATRVESKRLVDVTVIVGTDCEKILR